MREKLMIGKGQRRELHRNPQSHGKGCPAEHESYRADRLPRGLFSENAVDRGSRQRQNRNQPEIEMRRHSLSRFTWSTFSVSRVRYTAMMIASPTAASAAATTITKKTNTCPANWCQCAAKAT